MRPDERPPGADELSALSDPLLVLLLERAVNTSPDLERLLLRIRRRLLRSAVEGELSELCAGTGGEFLAALAQQCFLNEYVWHESVQEQAWVDWLSDHVAAELAMHGRVPGEHLALLATYRPLWELPFAAQVLRHYLPGDFDYLYKVVRLQLIGPLHEQGLRARVPSVSPITDETSRTVREQYERNPYPRWLYLDRHTPQPVADYLAGVFPHLAGTRMPLPANPRVLIAGCGTGKQAISAAMRFAGSEVLALDLSLASLAYARRMSDELNVGNVEYVQGDILAVSGKLGTFDIVECVGVLHHLRDPLAGWERLVDLLRPGGLLRIGLYSRQARRFLGPVRELCRAHGWDGSIEGIRAFRHHILGRPAEDPLAWLFSAADFFSTSECRDLVFHVHEHDFTLEQIHRALQRFELDFLGFELANERVFDAYRVAFPDDPHALELRRWGMLEQRYPDIFASMYQFWTRRR